LEFRVYRAFRDEPEYNSGSRVEIELRTSPLALELYSGTEPRSELNSA